MTEKKCMSNEEPTCDIIKTDKDTITIIIRRNGMEYGCREILHENPQNMGDRLSETRYLQYSLQAVYMATSRCVDRKTAIETTEDKCRNCGTNDYDVKPHTRIGGNDLLVCDKCGQTFYVVDSK